jgi:hypothetical protein
MMTHDGGVGKLWLVEAGNLADWDKGISRLCVVAVLGD